MMPTPRTCRYGHGALEAIAGAFALTGFVERSESGNAIEALFPKQRWAQDGRFYLVRIWRCPACGIVELIDEAA